MVGAGGHAASCIDVIEQEGSFDIAGLIGLPKELGAVRYGYQVIGTDQDFSKLVRSYSHAVITLGHIVSPDRRIELFQNAKMAGYELPVIVAPSAYVSPTAVVGLGTIVMNGAIVGTNAQIGNNCIVNSRALVEHGVSVGDSCHIATGALLNGDVVVGKETFIGSGSIVKEGVRVGERCFIAMGMLVRKDLGKGRKLLAASV